MADILLVPEFGMSGGTRTYFKALTRFYSKADHSLTVAITRPQHDGEVRKLLDQVGADVKYIPRRPTGLRGVFSVFPLGLIFDLVVLLPLAMRVRPDLLIVSNGTPGLFLGGFLLRTRMLYVMHTYPRRKLSIPMRRLLGRRLGQRRTIITVSQFARRQVIDLWLGGQESEHVRNVYNAVANVEHLPGEVHRVDHRPKRILTTGHVTWYKNPMVWIDVAEKVTAHLGASEVEFVWAGEGDKLAECRRVLADRDLSNVHFAGHTGDVWSLLATSDAYFQPSLVENLALSVLEAMRAGLACVVTDVGGLPEIVEDGETGFVINVDDEDSMVERLRFLVTDQDAATRLGASGLARLEGRFSYSRWHEQMTELHQRILEG